MRLILFLSVLTLGVVGLCQESTQPSKVESNQSQQSQEAKDHSPRVTLSIKDTKSLVVKRVKPLYPDIARNARLVGKCGVRVVITSEGKIAEVHLVYGHPIIAPAALDAVRKWKFKPYVKDGQAVEAEGEVELNVP